MKGECIIFKLFFSQNYTEKKPGRMLSFVENAQKKKRHEIKL